MAIIINLKSYADERFSYLDYYFTASSLFLVHFLLSIQLLLFLQLLHAFLNTRALARHVIRDRSGRCASSKASSLVSVIVGQIYTLYCKPRGSSAYMQSDLLGQIRTRRVINLHADPILILAN